MKEKTKTPEEVFETESEELLDFISSSKDAVKAIIEDYMIDDGAIAELDSAISNIENQVLKFIKAVEPKELTKDQLKDLLSARIDDEIIESEEVLEMFDTEEIESYLEKSGAYVIKDLSMDQTQKLKEFLAEHIYPHYNDQEGKPILD